MAAHGPERQVFRASPGRRRTAAAVSVVWATVMGMVAAAWWPLEPLHVAGLLLASLAVGEFVLSATRWRLVVTVDELQVTPTVGSPRRVARSAVAGVREQTARPPSIVVDDADDVPLPVGNQHHVEGLVDLLGSTAVHDHTDVGAPPGPLRTLRGLGEAPNPTLRSFTHHPRLWLAIVVLSGVSALLGLEAGLRWSRGESFLAVYPAPTAQPPSVPLVVIAGALVGPLLHAVVVAVLHGFARLLGGTGRFRRLYAGYAVAVLPLSLVLLPGWVGSLVAFWALFLVIVAVQEAERLSWWRATVALTLGLATIPTALALLAVVFGEPQRAASIGAPVSAWTLPA